MSAVFYIDVQTRSVLTVDPSATGTPMVEVKVPEGMPLSLLVSQLSSLNGSLPLQPEPLVIKVTVGDAE